MTDLIIVCAENRTKRNDSHGPLEFWFVTSNCGKFFEIKAQLGLDRWGRHLIVEADDLDVLREPRLLDVDRHYAGISVDEVVREIRDEMKIVLLACGHHGCVEWHGQILRGSWTVGKSWRHYRVSTTFFENSQKLPTICDKS